MKLWIPAVPGVAEMHIEMCCAGPLPVKELQCGHKPHMQQRGFILSYVSIITPHIYFNKEQSPPPTSPPPTLFMPLTSAVAIWIWLFVSLWYHLTHVYSPCISCKLGIRSKGSIGLKFNILGKNTF